MEINMDAYDCYVEELRYKGIPVDDYDDVEKMAWYVKFLDNLELSECEEESSQKMEKNFDELTNEKLLHQLKDDVGQLVGQLQLVTQRIERIEDQVYNDMKNNVKRVVTN